MPRRPRIDMVGDYHIVNRGVEQRVVYKEHEDYEEFLNILCTACQLYDVQLHGYVLMSNHYHLLIETKTENLSRFMKHINASYAIYFNKKYKRSGHLWQGRFKSWYVTDAAYLYALIGYIENNPLKAKMVKKLGDYLYSSYGAFSEMVMPLPCMKASFVFIEFPDVKERIEFLHYANDERVLDEIKKASNLVMTSIKSKDLDLDNLCVMFLKVDNNKERNQKIYEAYQLGYSQHSISKCIGISQPHVNRIVKQERGISIT